MKLKDKLYKIVFNTECLFGRCFDMAIIGLIILSMIIVCLASMATLQETYGSLFWALEWGLTILFTVEYGLRLYASKNPWQYASSFFGWVDLLSILPTYLALFITGGQYLLIIRLLRVMRIFRILKLFQYVSEVDLIISTLYRSGRKIAVFLMMVLILVTLLGSIMYVVEGEKNGFTNIPISIYWAIVTLTTVGYGDISPQTGLGKLISSIIMILGYCIIAVPTGLVSVDISQSLSQQPPHHKKDPSKVPVPEPLYRS